MSNIAKFGPFSDGGYRIRIVAPGWDADPAPTDPRAIIFDSDWPEVVSCLPGYFGSANVTYSTNSSGVNTSSNYTGSWTTLPFVPIVMFGEPSRAASSPTVSLQGSTAFYTLVAASMSVKRLTSATASGFTYVPVPADGSPANPISETYPIAWWVLNLDTTLLGNAVPASRAGTRYMKLDENGPVVAKPGADVSSTNNDDFLIPPLASLAMLGQPQLVGTVTNLPYYNTFSRTGVGNFFEYLTTIPHNLGYMPFVLVTMADNFNTGLPDVAVYVDSMNVYIYTVTNFSAASLDINPASYHIYRAQWF